MMANRKLDVPMRLCITCEKSGSLYLAEPDLTAGWLADKIWARLEVLKFAVDRNNQFSTLFSQGTALYQQL